MKKLNNYEKTQSYSTSMRLPVGGYVLKILNVKYIDNSDRGWNDQILLSFDIAEGEQKDFYRTQYNSQNYEDKKWKGTFRLRVPNEDDPKDPEWVARRFKSTIEDFEDSNSGYHWNWDEQTLKGLLIGGIFNNKEYDFNGKTGYFTNCCRLVTADKIRSGDFEVPADTLLKKDNDANFMTNNYEFMNLPDGATEIPFD